MVEIYDRPCDHYKIQRHTTYNGDDGDCDCDNNNINQSGPWFLMEFLRVSVLRIPNQKYYGNNNTESRFQYEKEAQNIMQFQQIPMLSCCLLSLLLFLFLEQLAFRRMNQIRVQQVLKNGKITSALNARQTKILCLCFRFTVHKNHLKFAVHKNRPSKCKWFFFLWFVNESIGRPKIEFCIWK